MGAEHGLVLLVLVEQKRSLLKIFVEVSVLFGIVACWVDIFMRFFVIRIRGRG